MSDTPRKGPGIPVARGSRDAEPLNPEDLGINLKPSQKTLDLIDKIERDGVLAERSMRDFILTPGGGVGRGPRAGEPVKVRAVHNVDFRTQDCPSCGADWRGEPIDEYEQHEWGGLTHYSKVKWARDQQRDHIIIFECPICGAEFAHSERPEVADARTRG